MKAKPLSTALRETTLAVKKTPPVSARSGPTASAARRGASSEHNGSSALRPPSRRAFSFPQDLASLEVRLRFRMRTFLIGVTAVSIVLGLLTAEARRLEMTVAEIQGRGGIVIYDSSWPDPQGAFNLRRTLAASAGDAWFGQPMAVIFPPDMHVTDEDLRLVSRIGSVETIHLDGYHSYFRNRKELKARDSVTDRGLAYLERLPRLKQLTLRGAAVTPTAVAAFRERRPACRVVDDPDERLTYFKL